jgi:MFS family permease
VQQSDHSLKQKWPIIFTVITVFGVVALLLGLALIIFAHYHERAYVFLGLGAGCFIGGIAGLMGVRSKVKAALSYGVIAMGMMGGAIGLNYLTSRYGPAPNQTHGAIVIALSIVAILAGIAGALTTQHRGSIVAFSTVIMLGVIASIGIVALIVGTVYLVVLQYQGHAYLLLSIGTACLIGGVACGFFVQNRARVTSR